MVILWLLLFSQSFVILFAGKFNTAHEADDGHRNWDVTKLRRQLSENTQRNLCHDWNERTIRIAAIPTFPPFLMMNRSSEGHWTPDGGVELKLIETLAASLHFRYTVLVPLDMEMGLKKENGTWTGILGTLVRKEAELGLSLIAINFDRYEIVDFTVPYISEPVTFFTRSPRAKSKTLVLVRPFSKDVWLGIFLSCIIGSVIFRAFTVLFRIENSGSSNLTLLRILWYLYGTMTTKGVPSRLYSTESWRRTFMTSWFLFVSVLVFSYNGNLLSSLVNPQKEPPISSLAQLQRAVIAKGYQCGSVDRTTVLENMKSADSGIMGSLSRAMSKNKENVAANASAGLRRTLAYRYALVLPRLLGEIAAIPLGRANFHSPNQDALYTIHLALAMQKNLPCAQAVRLKMIRILEAGLVNKWIEDYLKILRRQATTPSYEDSNHVLDLDDLQGAFYALLIGHATAISCLAAELLLRKWTTRH